MRHRLRYGPLVFRDPLLLCGALYVLLYFDASGFLRLGLLAAFLHEWGHIGVYLALFGQFPVIEVTLTGFCMRTRGREMTLWQTALLAAAGPAVNFVLAGLWMLRLEQRATIRASAFLAANLLTGAFNLLPIPPLDGAQMGLALREALRQRNQGLQFPRKSGKIKRMKKRSVNGGT
jgi:stage IV sporulation protein FB